MRNFISKYFFLLFLIVTTCSQAEVVRSSDGRQFDLSDFQGKWLVINYWADWCSACREELPEFNRLSQRHSNELTVVGVNFDGKSAGVLQQYANAHHVTFPLFSHFPLGHFGVRSDMAVLPTTILVNPNGKVFRVLTGTYTEREILRITGLSKKQSPKKK